MRRILNAGLSLVVEYFYTDVLILPPPLFGFLSPSLCPSHLPLLAGIRIRSLSVRWGWFVGLQAHTAAHHACQSQGPALLFGEQEIYQSLPFPLQGLSQIGSMSEGRGGGGGEGRGGEMKCVERPTTPSTERA